MSTDRARIDLDLVHCVLSASYWSAGIPREVVRRAIEGSMAFGVYATRGEQVGFARVVADRATLAARRLPDSPRALRSGAPGG